MSGLPLGRRAEHAALALVCKPMNLSVMQDDEKTGSTRIPALNSLLIGRRHRWPGKSFLSISKRVRPARSPRGPAG